MCRKARRLDGCWSALGLPAGDVGCRTARRGRATMAIASLGTRGRSGWTRTRNAGRPRVPGVAYSALSLVLLGLVATLALTSRQASPPTIAEFAPQAVERITDSSGDGAGSRGEAVRETSSSDELAAQGGAPQATIDVARV